MKEKERFKLKKLQGFQVVLLITCMILTDFCVFIVIELQKKTQMSSLK